MENVKFWMESLSLCVYNLDLITMNASCQNLQDMYQILNESHLL